MNGKDKSERPAVEKPEVAESGSLEETIKSLRSEVVEKAKEDIAVRTHSSETRPIESNYIELNKPEDQEAEETEPQLTELPPDTVEKKEGIGIKGILDRVKRFAQEQKQDDTIGIDNQSPSEEIDQVVLEGKEEKNFAPQEKEEESRGVEIPGKLTNDPDFKRTWGDLYSDAKKQHKDINISEIDQQALSKYYDKWARSQVEKGLPPEIKENPLYLQKLGQEVIGAADKGETLDTVKLSAKALIEYQRAKDLRAEKSGEQGEGLGVLGGTRTLKSSGSEPDALSS